MVHTSAVMDHNAYLGSVTSRLSLPSGGIGDQAIHIRAVAPLPFRPSTAR